MDAEQATRPEPALPSERQLQFAPMPVSELRRAEASLCSPAVRAHYWLDDQDEPAEHPLGRFICKLVEFRRDVASQVPSCARISQANIAGRIGWRYGRTITREQVGRFLRGERAGLSNWDEYGRDLVPFILLGGTAFPGPTTRPTRRQRPQQQVEADVESASVVKSVCELLFPPAGTEPGFLSEQLRECDHAATRREAVSELRSWVWEASNATSRGRCVIVRTSGLRRFLQIDAAGVPTRSFEPTVDALRSGVEVVYVVARAETSSRSSASPAFDTAEASARRICQLIDERAKSDQPLPVRVVELALSDTAIDRYGRRRCAAEYLHPIWRYVWYHFELETLREKLMLTRGSKFPASAFRAVDRELEDFRLWAGAFGII